MTEPGEAAFRADLALLRAGLFDSRAKARAAIEAGQVTADGVVVRKPSSVVSSGAVLAATAAFPWVSRGGVKLAAALDNFEIDPAGRACLDVGASTGGFCHVLLDRGAARVVAVDVGQAQLHPTLRGDGRLLLLESRDARSLTPDDLGEAPAIVTVDVSFISLGLVLPHVLPLAASGARLIALVKPQFEAGRGRVNKGVVRDPSIHEEVCQAVTALVAGLGWSTLGLIPSPIEGGDGNREFLLGARQG